jgi:hypothetical protein
VNWKKIIAVAMAAYVAPTVGQWANDCVGGVCAAFTVGNVIAPHAASLIATTVSLVSLFLSQPHKDPNPAPNPPQPR